MVRLNSSFILHPSGPPTKSLQRNAAIAIEDDSVGFEKQPLQFAPVGAAPRADLAARVDHSMPWNATAGWKRVERVADLPCMTLEPGQIGDLAVGRHTAAGNAADDLVDSSVCSRSHCTNPSAFTVK